MRICPKCGKKYEDHPAISRTDNRTEICPECGTREALTAAGIDEAKQSEILSAIREGEKNIRS